MARPTFFAAPFEYLRFFAFFVELHVWSCDIGPARALKLCRVTLGNKIVCAGLSIELARRPDAMNMPMYGSGFGAQP
jgi:hypothetical protein